MFGGFGISTDGLTIAILADLGDGEKLWLKGDDSTRSRYEAAGCKIFTYPAKGVPRTMNYFAVLKRRWIHRMRCGSGRRWRLIVLCGRGLGSYLKNLERLRLKRACRPINICAKSYKIYSI